MFMLKEFFDLIEEKAKDTNWEDLESIDEYNRYVRELEDKMFIHDEED